MWIECHIAGPHAVVIMPSPLIKSDLVKTLTVVVFLRDGRRRLVVGDFEVGFVFGFDFVFVFAERTVMRCVIGYLLYAYKKLYQNKNIISL